jgi:putative ABC transport system permease protein
LKGLRFVLAMAGRESRASFRRIALIVSAIMVGVGALVAINSFTENLQDSVRRQAKALLGADLAVSSAARFSATTLALLEELKGAAAGRGGVPAEARVTSFSAMAYVPRTSGTRLVQVAAVEPGYPFYGVIETAPPGEWDRLGEGAGALVDSSLLTALGARVGDTLALGEARFRIRGTVLNVPGDVGVRSAFGPRVFIPAGRVDETGLLTFGSRARYEAFFKLPEGADAQRLAERYRTPLNAERVNLRTVSEDQRRLNDTLTRLGRYLGLVALVALLLGGLGVASAVHVFVRNKMETVAVLRCLGASGGQVLAVYLVQSAAIGLLGSLAGALLGVLVQLALPRVLGAFLPVDVRITPSWPAILGGVALGLWVATVFSLLPLLAVRHVSPLVVLRRAYEDTPPPPRALGRTLAWLAVVGSVVALAVLQAGRLVPGLAFAAGVGVALGGLWLAALALTRVLRRFFPTRLPYLWRQGLANLYRPHNQTVTVVLALGFGAFLLSTLLLVQHNLLRDLRVDGGRERPNLVFFDIQPDQRPAVETRMRDAGLPVGPAVPIVPMRILSVKGRLVTQVLGAPGSAEAVRGRGAFRREYRSTHRDTLEPSERTVRGRFWTPGAGRGRAGGDPVPISMETGVAKELGVSVGDEIVWDVQGVPLPSRVACLREVEWVRFEPNFFVVFPEGPLDEAPQTYLMVSRIEDPERRAGFQRGIVETFPNISALDLSLVQQAVEAILAKVAWALRFMALFSLAAGAVVLLGALAASRHQRIREGVLLRTLGATRAQVLRVLIAEYLSLGVLSSLAALLLSCGAGWGLVRFGFETGFHLPGPPLVGLALGVVALTVGVGLWSSTEVFRRTPLEVLREE